MLLRKLATVALTRKGEFAPGIPASKERQVIPVVHHEKPELWHMSVQQHLADKAGCFTWDTSISFADGSRSIASAKIGDSVLLPKGRAKVVRVWQNGPSDDWLSVSSGARSVVCTPNHRFWLCEFGWVPVVYLIGRPIYVDTEGLLHASFETLCDLRRIVPSCPQTYADMQSSLWGASESPEQSVERHQSYPALFEGRKTQEACCFSGALGKVPEEVSAVIQQSLASSEVLGEGVFVGRDSGDARTSVKGVGDFCVQERDTPHNPVLVLTRQFRRESADTLHDMPCSSGETFPRSSWETLRICRMPRVQRNRFDLEIEGAHCYYAGGFLVHNSHIDLRLVDPEGLAHSWAIPANKLPVPGERVLGVPQPTHTKEYAARKGKFKIPKGYGKGTVVSSGLVPVEVVRSAGSDKYHQGLLRFNVYGGSKDGVQEYNIVETPKGSLLHNVTSTATSGVRGVGGMPIPLYKPDYKEKSADTISFGEDREIHQAKLDGAHCTFHLRGDRPIKVFSHRPTERSAGVLEHTHKLPDYRNLTATPDLTKTVLRGELVAVDKKTGKALPAEHTGGMLNATVWTSRDKQKELGAELRPYIFDVVYYKGKSMEKSPYEEKLRVLREINSKVSRLQLPPTAETPAEKLNLFSKIQAGEHPLTNEGVVVWKKDEHQPTKVKFRPDLDVEVVGITPGKGKHEGRIGALQVRLPGKDAITNVGTGFSDQLRADIAKNPDAFIGRVAKVTAQQVFPSGRLRGPAFVDFHIEKGKQPESSDVPIAAYVIGPSGAGKTTYVKKNYPADKFFLLHSDKYAKKIKGDTVKIDWNKALKDAATAGKPVVIDAYHVNKDLMAKAQDKILLDPGRYKVLEQMQERRSKSKKKAWTLTPEQKLERFDTKVRPIALEMGFKVKTAGILLRNPER